ncbi:MAG: anti-anti-sigma factor, partial [Chromatocurvus sp.]
GQLARLAQRVYTRHGFRPAIYSCDDGINRLLHSMGFKRLFDLHEDACSDSTVDVEDIPLVPGSEDVVKDRVIEAHRALMGVSDENAERFRDLMAVLEAS